MFKSSTYSQQIVDTGKYEFFLKIELTNEDTIVRRAFDYGRIAFQRIQKFKVLESNYKFPLNEILIFIDTRIFHEHHFEKAVVYKAILKRKVKDEISFLINEKDKFLYLFESISLFKSPLYQYQKPLPHNF